MRNEMMMSIDLSTPVRTARFLVPLGIYSIASMEQALVCDFGITAHDASEIVADAVEFYSVTIRTTR